MTGSSDWSVKMKYFLDFVELVRWQVLDRGFHADICFPFKGLQLTFAQLTANWLDNLGELQMDDFVSFLFRHHQKCDFEAELLGHNSPAAFGKTNCNAIDRSGYEYAVKKWIKIPERINVTEIIKGYLADRPRPTSRWTFKNFHVSAGQFKENMK